MLSAAKAGRLRAEIYAVGTISFTGTSEGAASTRATYSLTQTFRVEGALNSNNRFFNMSGDADSDPDDGVYDGAYSYSETYTLDNPFRQSFVRNGRIRLSRFFVGYRDFVVFGGIQYAQDPAGGRRHYGHG